MGEVLPPRTKLIRLIYNYNLKPNKLKNKFSGLKTSR